MTRRLRNLVAHVRQAAVLKPGWLFLWREVVRRRPVERAYRLRATGQTVILRHRTPDLGGVTEVFVNDNYAFSDEILGALAPSRPLRAVDLGANIGLFGLKLLAACPDAQIVAVEPDPENARVLRATIAANDAAASWTVVEACAAVRDGTQRFLSGRFLTSRASPEGTPRPAIDVFPLLHGADVVKIDIEGAEGEILADERFGELTAAVLFLEYHPPHTREAVLGRLRAAGYAPGPFSESGDGHADLWALRVARSSGAGQ